MRLNNLSIVRVYQWLNLLSIDVCIGAIAGGIMVSKLLDVNPDWAYWVVLPLAVWLIYTSDHIIDGYRTGKNAAHIRHIFFQTHRRLIISISSIILVITAFISFTYLPANIVLFGSILGLLTFIYLTIVFFIPAKALVLFQKEVLVAFLYTAGIWGPVVVIKQSLTFIEGLIMCMFFLLAFCNLILLSIIEINTDRKEGQRSFPIFYGTVRSSNLLYLIGITILSVSVFVIIINPSCTNIKAAIILCLMQICLFLILNLHKPLPNNGLSRNLTEAVFFLPALMLI